MNTQDCTQTDKNNQVLHLVQSISNEKNILLDVVIGV